LAVLQNVFKIRPEELKTTGLAFVYLFFAIGAFIIGRITRTVLFLEIPDYKQQLPLAYIGIAISVSTAMYLYSRVQGKLRRDRTNAITLVLLIAGTLSFRFALRDGGESVYWAFYFWVEVFGTFLVVQFWTMTNEIFHSRQAKRLFALIGGGGVLSNVFIGFFVSGSVRALGTENLLYIISACMAVSLVAVLMLGQIARVSLEGARDRAPKRTSSGAPVSRKKVFATRHVQLIALVVILTYIVSTLVDYQFQAILGDYIPGKDDRSAYLGNFFAITGLIGGFIQFFITARILERFGLLIALILLPIMMLSGSVGLLALPFALGAVTFTKGSENCLRYTINDSTLQLLYLPLPGTLRSRAKATIDGILKPLSIGVAGLLMALLVGRLDQLLGIDIGLTVETEQFGWAAVLGLVGWLAALFGLRREYMKSLLQTLHKRRLNFADANFEISDEQTLETVRQSLTSEDMGEVLHALDLVPFVSGKGRDAVHEHVAELLTHDVEDVRVHALNTLRRARAKISGTLIVPLLEDESPQVRASAVMTLASVTRERAIPEAQALLDDDDLKVRSAAVAGFVRYGGLDGVLASAERLKTMLGSEEPKERAEAAWVLGEVGVQTFYQPLLPLLADENEEVRLAAVRAAGRMKPPELIESLIDCLGRPRLKRATVAALASFGQPVFAHVVPLLENDATPRAIRAQLPRVIAALPAGVSLDILMRFIRDPDAEVRDEVLRGLIQLKDSTPGIRLDDAKLSSALREEAEAYFQAHAIRADLALEGGKGSLLIDALENREKRSVQRILWLLGLRYPLETIRLVAQNLRSTVVATRANAVEVLDNLLDKREKPIVIPIIEENRPQQKLLAGSEHFSLERKGREAWLETLLGSEDPWLTCCAAVAVGDHRLTQLENQVASLLKSKHAVCRETAIVVLRDLGRSGLQKELKPLVKDPEPQVSRFARFVRDTLAGASKKARA
ncbi:MAG: Npt1/Npt2 family nucleotide transporter, partial [Myxococcota bacterium]